MSKTEHQLLCPDLQSLWTTQFLELIFVPYMDLNIYESSFTRTWNHINWVIEEKVMPDGVTEGQSAQKNTFCRFEHPSWSSLFLWQGHITTHVYDVIKHVEGSRVEDNQI